jgi:hypothetical protein
MKTWETLKGKKTYLIALVATIYAWGISHQLWTNDPLIDAVLGGSLAAALRHGWKTEAAKILAALVADPPELPDEEQKDKP